MIEINKEPFDIIFWAMNKNKIRKIIIFIWMKIIFLT